ncbi:hypothetical protein BU23DRAFT_550272 [Bimuria novae-zelandiae CBS 107.79]|uniref:Cupin 2 conserved barrel domain-containing protein n=1 Tax=Bimuria novae-zelandiae CBS 107.79 TaxID=1447943 RepID=A0A6A5VNW7_9PLEO|nr:hypothetical protein BU23DRAFT_550272 [Bimuria novae-zelandiae CBS 107.79]
MASKFAEPTIEKLAAAKRISGPFSQFEDSVIFEYLEPPASLNATVLIRATYVNPAVKQMNKSERKHPQSPPLHLHFDQWESFAVASGKVCTIETYEAKDLVHVKEDGVHRVPPWVPHTFYPCADATEDTTFYMWAHPEAVPEPMDRLFFQTLLGLVSDIHEKKAPMSVLQIMTTQHASATAIVMFPRAWWLGPLRWWIPWTFQSLAATIGTWLGYKALIERYVSAEEWDSYAHSKRS